MSAFPLGPRYGKMLALSHQHSLLPYTVVLVAALTVPEVLTETPLDARDNYNGDKCYLLSLVLKGYSIINMGYSSKSHESDLVPIQCIQLKF